MLEHIREKYPSQVHDFLSGLQKSAASYTSQVIQHAVAAFGTVAGSLLAVVSVLILLPLYTFFFLWRFDRVVGFLGGLIPGRHRDRVVLVVKQIDQTLASFFRGRLIVCGIVGVATAIGYLIAGVPFALVLGLLVGVLNLVPYLSVVVGLPITLVVCYLAHFDLAHPLYALIAFTVVQMLDNFFLTPVIQGKAVGLHPITMVVVLLIGSELAGLLGLILAVPAAAVIKILLREFVLPELKPVQGASCGTPSEPAESQATVAAEAETTDQQPKVPG
jgi:predicted PurR-regulated permease PerM